jgi:glycine cleavage system transcriptional repressor
MLTIIGRDQPKIVSRVSRALFEGGCNLGEASMIRLGGYFTIMLMVQHAGEPAAIEAVLRPVAAEMDLRLSLEPIDGALHAHEAPDVCITVHGADRAGIVAQVTSALSDAGLNILDLRSDVAGSPERPIYVMQIEGRALQGIEALKQALADAGVRDIEATVAPITTLIG